MALLANRQETWGQYRNPRNQRPAFGTLLVRDGAVTAEQLDQELTLQSTQPERRLGEILLAEGVVTPLAISRVLADQHELELIELDFDSIEISAALLLPESLARRSRWRKSAGSPAKQ